MKKYYFCHKCKKEIWGQGAMGDDTYSSIKGKCYCEKCFYTPDRIKEIHRTSISLMEFIKEGIEQ